MEDSKYLNHILYFTAPRATFSDCDVKANSTEVNSLPWSSWKYKVQILHSSPMSPKKDGNFSLLKKKLTGRRSLAPNPPLCIPGCPHSVLYRKSFLFQSMKVILKWANLPSLMSFLSTAITRAVPVSTWAPTTLMSQAQSPFFNKTGEKAKLAVKHWWKRLIFWSLTGKTENEVQRQPLDNH